AHLAANRFPVGLAGALGGLLSVDLRLLGGAACHLLGAVAQLVQARLVLTIRAGAATALPLEAEIVLAGVGLLVAFLGIGTLEVDARAVRSLIPAEAEAMPAEVAFPRPRLVRLRLVAVLGGLVLVLVAHEVSLLSV